MLSWKGALGSLSTSLAFLTRIPLPSFLFRDPISAARAAWAFPLVGLLIGLAQMVALVMLSALGLHPLVAAVLVLGGSILLTGALHEDGLGDVADSLGGGTREKKLAIMKDSRLGTFGVLALILMVAIKLALLFELARDLQTAQALAVLVGAGMVSRALMTLIWALLPAASATGLAAERPSMLTAGVAMVIGALGVVVLLPLQAGLVLCGLLAAGLVFAAFAVFARWQYGGVTGDVCGATQILCELAFFGAALSLITTW
ncbi:MAG: adenosylcobinamide-GDP ribazoletransferase [Alphaproteobacteria bacterium]